MEYCYDVCDENSLGMGCYSMAMMELALEEVACDMGYIEHCELGGGHVLAIEQPQ